MEKPTYNPEEDRTSSETGENVEVENEMAEREAEQKTQTGPFPNVELDLDKLEHELEEKTREQDRQEFGQ